MALICEEGRQRRVWTRNLVCAVRNTVTYRRPKRYIIEEDVTIYLLPVCSVKLNIFSRAWIGPKVVLILLVALYRRGPHYRYYWSRHSYRFLPPLPPA